MKTVPQIAPMPRSTAGASNAEPWYPDCGDGTYRNPVLFADYSDPDAIRVGEDYWLISSSFNHVPGLPILHSRDLVNWSLVNHALPRLVPDAHFARPRHGDGVWAPAIRFHEGKFWIFYADPDFGIYVLTAKDPRGAWSEPVVVKAGKGLIDPCPFWDEDGSGYLIHGWARSRAGIANQLTLHRLAPDSRTVADSGQVVIDGNTLPGWHTLEGPKLYRRGEFYYVFAPAGGVKDGYQALFRGRAITGPYEARIVLERGTSPINGPHQGAWVDTPEGSHWFLHFQETPAHGRVVHLQPLQWREDGWPQIGEDRAGDGRGQPVLRHAKPRVAREIAGGAATSDDFDAPQLGLQWQWQANPAPDFYSLGAAPGKLRLFCWPACAEETFWRAPNLLLQKFPGPAFVATTRLVFAPKNQGERAGLVVFGYDYAWVGLRRTDTGLQLTLVQCRGANEGNSEQEMFSIPFDAESVQVRVTVGRNADCDFGWSADGTGFHAIPVRFCARPSAWVGAKVGLFASGLSREVRGHAGRYRVCLPSVRGQAFFASETPKTNDTTGAVTETRKFFRDADSRTIDSTHAALRSIQRALPRGYCRAADPKPLGP